jgi:hypothetical protein
MVVAADTQGLRVLLQPDEAQRAAVLAKLHTRDDAVGTTRTNFGGLAAALLRRATRS